MVAGYGGDSSNGEEGMFKRLPTGARAFSLTEKKGGKSGEEDTDFQGYPWAVEWMVGGFTDSCAGEEGSWLEMTQSWEC